MVGAAVLIAYDLRWQSRLAMLQHRAMHAFKELLSAETSQGLTIIN